MARFELVVLSVICLICVSQAFLPDLALNRKSRVSVTRIGWKGDTCSGYTEERVTGPLEGCSRLFGRSTWTFCSNATGSVVYSFSSEDCTGQWYHATATGVNQCTRYLGGGAATAYFCGDANFVPTNFNRYPIPLPNPEDGKISEKNVACDYAAGTCPTDTPIQLFFDEQDCAGPARAFVMYPGLLIGKCYLLLDQAGQRTYNFEALHQNGGIYFVKYNSGCHAGNGGIHTDAYPANRCLNMWPGSSKIIVPS